MQRRLPTARWLTDAEGLNRQGYHLRRWIKTRSGHPPLCFDLVEEVTRSGDTALTSRMEVTDRV